MSRTLHLVDQLLSKGRRLQSLGLNPQARRVLTKLAAFRQLPPTVAEETQVRLADLDAEADDHESEQVHRAAALTHDPRRAEYHSAMAHCRERDEMSSPEEVVAYHRRADALDPENPRILRDYGMSLLRAGDVGEGLDRLREAHELAAHDLGILECLAIALTDAGMVQEADDLLRTAMFRQSGDRRFVELRRRHQFRRLADEQAGPPVLLPFPGSTPKPRRFQLDGQIFRIDAAEHHSGPRNASRARRKNQSP